MIDERQRRQRWLIFFILSLIYILVYFYRVSLAVVAKDVSRDLHLTPAQLGSLSSILFYVYAAAQIPLGPMIDRLGSRVVISGCGVLTAIGGILFSQAGSMGQALVARILIGIGTASVLMATFSLFSHWFTRQEFGKVSGLMVAVGNMGNLAGTAPLALAVAWIGWRNSFLAIGVMQALATVLVFLLVRDRPAVAVEGAGEPAPVKMGMLQAWKHITTNRDFWLLAGLAFAWYGCYLAVQGLWGGPYLMEVLKLSREETGRMLMFTSIGFICGSLVIDSIARKLAHSYKKTFLWGQILLLILMTGFQGPLDHLPLLLLGAYFFCLGLAVSSGVMIYPVNRSMFPVSIVGTALTSINLFVLLGAASVQQIMGMVLDAVGKTTPEATAQAFHSAFLVPVGIQAVAAALFFLARDYWEEAKG
ncbi:MFS transporter [Geomonas sp. Red69]|uniref:MFS transporter n=1 Tax=Geomonas diazotrophica TaxID=2843197 RepID=UPI001C104BBD|nr:MFS transporter [Geomonas diazotrophica]MBU5635512.1 MFS transporter [Geomonas diazotrophica]